MICDITRPHVQTLPARRDGVVSPVAKLAYSEEPSRTNQRARVWSSMSIGSLSIPPQFTVRRYGVFHSLTIFHLYYFLLCFLFRRSVHDCFFFLFFWLRRGCNWSSKVNETGTSSYSWALLNFSKLQGGRSRGRNLSRRFLIRNGYGGFTHNLAGVGVRDGIIIVDHGSRRKESNLLLSKLNNMWSLSFYLKILNNYAKRVIFSLY